MKRRTQKKRARRSLRLERKMLVHAAGCVVPDCGTKHWDVLLDPELMPSHPVSVPRSLRTIIGRFMGGA